MPRHTAPDDRSPLPGDGRMEDYTNAFLVTAGVLAFCALFAVWATWGLLGAALAGYLADWLIARAARR